MNSANPLMARLSSHRCRRPRSLVECAPQNFTRGHHAPLELHIHSVNPSDLVCPFRHKSPFPSKNGGPCLKKKRKKCLWVPGYALWMDSEHDHPNTKVFATYVWTCTLSHLTINLVDTPAHPLLIDKRQEYDWLSSTNSAF